MEEKSIKQLFRRFALHECGPEETLKVIELLQNEDHIQWFGDIMDQMRNDHTMLDEPVTDTEIEERYLILESKLDPPIYEARVRRLWWSRYTSIAASLTGILLLTAVAIYFFKQNTTVVQKTGYGEIRNVRLPDGSTVVLNGNSMITYQKNWEKERQVMLDGEAYFSVTRTPDRKPFTVEMTNTGEIEVLGTEFNVNYRNRNSEIVLRSGLIRLKLPGSIGQKNLLMHPGELVEFSSNVIQKKQVNPAVYDTWTSRKLIFENTSLREIAVMLKENYNLDVEVTDPTLLEKKISGTAPIQDLTQFLNALSGSFNLEITRDQHRLIIQAAP